MQDDHDLLGDELIRAVELLAEAFAAQSIHYALPGRLLPSFPEHFATLELAKTPGKYPLVI